MEDSKVGSGRVLENVPPGRDVAAEQIASNRLPVGLSVVNAGNGLVLGRTGSRPTSLGDPDGLAIGNTLDSVVLVEEQRVGVGDCVRLGVLVVGVLIETNEINSSDNGRVARVNISCPGVDVAYRGRAKSSAGDGRSNLTNVVDKDLRGLASTSVGGNTSGGLAVEVLATN